MRTLSIAVAVAAAALVTGCNSLLGWEDAYTLGADGGVDATIDAPAVPDAGGDHAVAHDAAAGDADTGPAMDASTDAPVGPCTPSSCAQGCCGGDGQCHAMSQTTCGINGGSCETCTAVQKCDAPTGKCVASCSSSNCANGCCDGTTGACVTNTTTANCGTNGATCGPCTGTNQCVAGKCGCTTTADCPVNEACDVTSHSCSNTCVVGGVTLTCNTGCCDANGTMLCVTGAAGGTLCGVNGAVCTDCSTQSMGHVCQLGGGCGCAVAGDCPANQACTSKACGTACTGSLTCNGGCCDGTTCQLGTAPGSCGSGGGSCNDCTGSAAGHACLTPGDTCGCTSNGDCVAPATCGGGGAIGLCGCTPGVCGSQCGSVPDGCGGTLSCGNCNGVGCCSSTHFCAPGTSNNDCGENGNLCRTCIATGVSPQCGTINGVTNCYCTPASCAKFSETCSLATGTCQ